MTWQKNSDSKYIIGQVKQQMQFIKQFAVSIANNVINWIVRGDQLNMFVFSGH